MPRTLALAATLAIASISSAQVAAPPPASTAPPEPPAAPTPTPAATPADFFSTQPERWTIQFEPAAWYVAPSGQVFLPGAPQGAPRSDFADLNLDSPRFTPFGELHLRSDQWRITLSGFAFSEQDRSATQVFTGQIGRLPFTAGDRLVSSFNIGAFEASGGYTFHPHQLQGDQFKASIEPLGGMRFYNVDFHITGPTGSTSSKDFFGHPFVGAKLSMDILRDFTIDVQLDAGYFPSDTGGATGYDILAGFMYRPTENVGIQIGYRDQAYFLRSGTGSSRFSYDGALQGVYLGAVVRF